MKQTKLLVRYPLVADAWGDSAVPFNGAVDRVRVLIEALAHSGKLNVAAWVDGEVDNLAAPVPLVSVEQLAKIAPTPIQRIGYKVRNVKSARQRLYDAYRNGVGVFIVRNVRYFPAQVEMLVARGGKAIVVIEPHVDVPALVEKTGIDEFRTAFSQVDRVVVFDGLYHGYLSEILAGDVVSMPLALPEVQTVTVTPAARETVLWHDVCEAEASPWICLEAARKTPSQPFVMVLHAKDAQLYRCVEDEAQGIPNLTLMPDPTRSQIRDAYACAQTVASTSMHGRWVDCTWLAAQEGVDVVSLYPSAPLVNGRHFAGEVDAFISASSTKQSPNGAAMTAISSVLVIDSWVQLIKQVAHG